ncbi:MAG: hypothetical protein QOF15_2396, partial [Mycobacterium sp.]|nr:hypothetical protein [Mycobacterium sp.]
MVKQHSHTARRPLRAPLNID